LEKIYPEIEALNKIFIQHSVVIKNSQVDFLNDDRSYSKVEITVSGKDFQFYVEDEYDDFRYNYPLLNLCVVLRELEYYQESATDYSLWCKEHGFDSKNSQISHHFKGLASICKEMGKIIGKIDSKVSDWDFQMSSGAGGVLRKLS